MKSVFRMMPDAMNTKDGKCLCGSARMDFAVYAQSLFHWLNAHLSMPKGELLDIETRGSSMKKVIHKIPFATRNAIPRKAAAIFSRLSLAASILLLSSSAISFAQAGAAISGQAISPGGTPALHARLTVCPYTASGIPCSPQANIYSNPGLTGSPLPQPYATDQNGNYGFWVTPGTSYLVQVSVNQTITYSYIYTATNANGCVTSSTNFFLLGNAGPCINSELQQGADLGVFATGQPDYGQGTVTSYGFFGPINNGLATNTATTTTAALKQDARIVTDVAITASSGVITSATAKFTTADNSRIAIIYPDTALNVVTINAAGSGWAQNDRCSVAGGTGGILTMKTVSSGVPTAVQIENSGVGYSAGVTGSACTAILPSTGTGLTVNVAAYSTSPSTSGVGLSARSYTGALTVTNSTTATLSSAYSDINSTNATLILGTDDGAAFNALVNTIPANSAKGALSLGCKPILTTVTLQIGGGRATQVDGCGMSSGILAGMNPGAVSGTTIIWAGAAHPVTTVESSSGAGTTVTMTDPAGHGFYGTYCQIVSAARCYVNLEGMTQSALNGTFLIQSIPSTTTLTFISQASGLANDSGFMPANDVVKLYNTFGSTVHDLNIMGSDQPSTKPRALISLVDGVANYYFPNSGNDIYNLYLGNLYGYGSLPGNQYLSTSTAMWGIFAPPELIQDDRNNIRNVYCYNTDICYGAEQNQPVDWIWGGTVGCAFSGACFSLTDGSSWQATGTVEPLQNGVDFMLATGAHLAISKIDEETDGPARVYAPQVQGPANQPASSMLVEGFSYINGGVPAGTLTIDHGLYPPSQYLPTAISLPTYVSGGGLGTNFGLCTFAAANGGGQGATLILNNQGGTVSWLSLNTLGFGYTSDPTLWNWVTGTACSGTIVTSGGTIYGDMAWSNGSEIDLRFTDFTWGASGSIAEPIHVPVIDFTIPNPQANFLCRGCAGLAQQNFRLPTPGIGAASHFVVIENDSLNPNGQGQNGVPSHSLDILAGNDTRTYSNFRQDVPADLNVMAGHADVPQLAGPANVYSFACATSGSTTYYYKVTSCNSHNECSTPVAEFNTGAVCANTVSSTNTVKASFYGVPGADHYNIYRTAASGVSSGTYTSGGTITGTTGQTCTLTSFNNSSSAAATVALTGSNTIAGGTALVMTSFGYGATAAPTSATLGNGTATCSGTAVIATVLGGSGSELLAQTLQANTYTGQIQPNTGSYNSFTDSTLDGSLGAAPPTVNATGTLKSYFIQSFLATAPTGICPFTGDVAFSQDNKITFCPSTGGNWAGLTLPLSSITGGASGAYAYNFNAATNFKLPASSGFVSSGAGSIGFDTFAQIWHIWIGSDFYMGILNPTGLTNHDCAQIQITGGIPLIQDSGSPCSNVQVGTVTSASGTVTTARTFSTAFTATPNCTASPYSNSGAWYFSTLPSTTSSGVITYATSGAQTFSVHCVGVGGVW